MQSVVVQSVTNPFRSEVLSWYRKCIKSAFEVNWETTDDALYVLQETRRLFRQNERLREVEVIEKKVREVEMRYELAVHYRIPYPRPYNKAHGSIGSSGVEYIPYMDSSFDGCARNPNVPEAREGVRSASYHVSFSDTMMPDNDIGWNSERERGGQ